MTSRFPLYYIIIPGSALLHQVRNGHALKRRNPGGGSGLGRILGQADKLPQQGIKLNGDLQLIVLRLLEIQGNQPLQTGEQGLRLRWYPRGIETAVPDQTIDIFLTDGLAFHKIRPELQNSVPKTGTVGGISIVHPVGVDQQPLALPQGIAAGIDMVNRRALENVNELHLAVPVGGNLTAHIFPKFPLIGPDGKGGVVITDDLRKIVIQRQAVHAATSRK